MKFLLILLLLVFPFGQLARINLFDGEVTLHLNDAMVFLVVTTWFLKNPKVAGQSIRQSKLFAPLGAFFGVIAVSLVFNSSWLSAHQLFVSALYAVRFFVFAGLFFVFKDLPKPDQNFIKRYLNLGMVTVAIAGLLQYVFLPDVSFLKTLGWDDHYFRLISTFLDPGFTGAILVLGIIFDFKFLVSRDSRIKKLALLMLFYVAFVLTYSRASYLMFLASGAVISFFQKSVKIFLIAAIALAVTIPLLPHPTGEGVDLTRENSTWGRINNWKDSILIWQQHPILGVGFDAYRYVKPDTNLKTHSGAGADSSLFLVLATSGILGLGCYLWIWKRAIFLGRKNVVFLAGLAGILVHSFFNNTLFYPWIMEWLWITLALTFEV